ncbi:phosphotransferase enzyme family protein [Amycolatopsis nigrescens]|uniref:phosphotransferase enzyme family protein n=1 Tax=Amycolatopsis nigrescens TaxID=381445 RepID=UPI0009FDAD1F|nr:phosphotransferase [Amycolatopsis nigrescens]
MASAAKFTPETTTKAAEAACRAVQLDPTGAELIRMGENALFKLATAPVMVRVGRSAEASHKEAEVARWLSAHNYPAVALADVEQQPHEVNGMAVTFWEFITSGDSRPTSGDLGTMLRRLHGLPWPKHFTLPSFDPMPKVARRLDKIGPSLCDGDRTFLHERSVELAAQFKTLEFSLRCGPIHGDAHRDNLIRSRETGKVKLIDFEDFCIGPREWDLCVEAIGYSVFGWISRSDYYSYVRACGFDALEWSGFRVIKAIRELNMTTWLAQMVGQSAKVDKEVTRRIRDLRDDDAPRCWSVF